MVAATCRFMFLSLFCFNAEALSLERINSIEQISDNLVQGLAKNIAVTPVNVKIGTLLIKDTSYASEFADQFFLNYMERQFKKYPIIFKRISRIKITTRDLGFERIKTDVSKNIKEVVLEGNYHEDSQKDKIYISTWLVDENGQKISEYSINVDKSAIKWNLKPQNLSKIQDTEENIGHAPSEKDFNLDLWIDRGNGGIYRAGENISVMVRAEVDSYIKVLYIDAAGNRTLMFPTKRDTKTKLKKGVIYKLDENNIYKIIPPFGAEMIMAFASTVPFSNTGEINMGGGFRGFSANKKISAIVRSLRGISVKGKKNALTQSMHSKRSEARVYLTTVRSRQ